MHSLSEGEPGQTISGRRCDLCGGTRYERVSDCDRRGRPLATVACTGCGLVGHEVIPSEEELAAYYAAQYRKEYHGEESPSCRRVLRAWYKGERVYRALGPWLRPGERVFEVGAGIGCTVKVFELAGHATAGIDPGAGFQAFAHDRLQARVGQGTLWEVPARPAYDLVLLIHVIEHFRSPRRALEHIRRLLRPGGRLYLECPSLAKVHADPSEMFHFAHVHTFTPFTLVELARRCGFVVQHCFSDGLGRNLRFLFAGTGPGAAADTSVGYKQTRAILDRYRAPWHRLGWGYFKGRLAKHRVYLHEYLCGFRAVRRIVERCQQAGARPGERGCLIGVS
jgi:SAM-dependent methyltransferase